MKIYITRHGQVATQKGVDDPFYPPGENQLTDLGREQARLTGERLRELGFKGKIYSSPFLRTMETADIIADILGLKIYPFAPIQECVNEFYYKLGYPGKPLSELRTAIKNIADDAELDFPWRYAELEDSKKIRERIKCGVESIDREGDVLFVGHGASAWGLITYYKIPQKKGYFLYNCSLSVTDPEDSSFEPVFCDISHMPDDMVTNNHETKAEREEREEREKNS